MKTAYVRVIRDENNLIVMFRGADLPAGLAAFGRRSNNVVIITCPGYDVMPARVACDYLRDNGVWNLVDDGTSCKGITRD